MNTPWDWHLLKLNDTVRAASHKNLPLDRDITNAVANAKDHHSQSGWWTTEHGCRFIIKLLLSNPVTGGSIWVQSGRQGQVSIMRDFEAQITREN